MKTARPGSFTAGASLPFDRVLVERCGCALLQRALAQYMRGSLGAQNSHRHDRFEAPTLTSPNDPHCEANRHGASVTRSFSALLHYLLQCNLDTLFFGPALMLLARCTQKAASHHLPRDTNLLALLLLDGKESEVMEALRRTDGACKGIPSSP